MEHWIRRRVGHMGLVGGQQLHLLQLLGNGGNLFDAILVGGQIRLKGFVLLLEGLQLVELALTEVLGLQHLFLATCPVLVSVGLSQTQVTLEKITRGSVA